MSCPGGTIAEATVTWRPTRVRRGVDAGRRIIQAYGSAARQPWRTLHHHDGTGTVWANRSGTISVWLPSEYTVVPTGSRSDRRPVPAGGPVSVTTR
jgi:hypothetical protein